MTCCNGLIRAWGSRATGAELVRSSLGLPQGCRVLAERTSRPILDVSFLTVIRRRRTEVTGDQPQASRRLLRETASQRARARDFGPPGSRPHLSSSTGNKKKSQKTWTPHARYWAAQIKVPNIHVSRAIASRGAQILERGERMPAETGVKGQRGPTRARSSRARAHCPSANSGAPGSAAAPSAAGSNRWNIKPQSASSSGFTGHARREDTSMAQQRHASRARRRRRLRGRANEWLNWASAAAPPIEDLAARHVGVGWCR